MRPGDVGTGEVVIFKLGGDMLREGEGVLFQLLNNLLGDTCAGEGVLFGKLGDDDPLGEVRTCRVERTPLETEGWPLGLDTRDGS